MLIPFALSPNIFNFNGLDAAACNERLFQINLLLKIISARGLVLLDNSGCLRGELEEFVKEIKDDNLAKRAHILVKRLFTNVCRFEINLQKVAPIDDMHQYCTYFFSVIKNNPDIYAFYGADGCKIDCKACNLKLVTNPYDRMFNISDVRRDEIINLLDSTSIVSIDEFNVQMLKDSVFKNLLKFSYELTIFDNQMIPDIQEQNRKRSSFAIQNNYSYNLDYWLQYFYKVNPKLKIILYLSVKINQSGIKNDIISAFVNFKNKILKNFPSLSLELRVIEENKASNNTIIVPHQRYFMSNVLGFSCDRGIDLLFNGDNVRDFNISLISQNDRVKLLTHLKTNSQTVG